MTTPPNLWKDNLRAAHQQVSQLLHLNSASCSSPRMEYVADQTSPLQIFDLGGYDAYAAVLQATLE